MHEYQLPVTAAQRILAEQLGLGAAQSKPAIVQPSSRNDKQMWHQLFVTHSHTKLASRNLKKLFCAVWFGGDRDGNQGTNETRA
jgi:phosphoenolpyruvate carboxylase